LGRSNFANLLNHLERNGGAELARFDTILDNPYYQALYTLVRWLRPETIVETGVSRGVSSKIILSALEDNGAGTLYSIDLPNAKWIDENGTRWDDSISKGVTTGHVVPKNLRSRWNLVISESRTMLPALLNRIGPIDVFIHDSEHSYAHMMFEFSAAWPFVRDSGLMISDDADYNNAFKDFVGSSDGRFARTFVKNSDGHKYGLAWHTSMCAELPTARSSWHTTL
jgi:predicted O-methyltransferase YrrM